MKTIKSILIVAAVLLVTISLNSYTNIITPGWKMQPQWNFTTTGNAGLPKTKCYNIKQGKRAVITVSNSSNIGAEVWIYGADANCTAGRALQLNEGTSAVNAKSDAVYKITCDQPVLKMQISIIARTGTANGLVSVNIEQ